MDNEDPTPKLCDQCRLPHHSASSTCPRCRVEAATWYEPSAIVQDLIRQVNALADALYQAWCDKLELETTLGHAYAVGETDIIMAEIKRCAERWMV